MEHATLILATAKHRPANPLELTRSLPSLNLPVTRIVVMSFSFHAASISQLSFFLALLIVYS
jgi:hypothetical protein